MDAKDGFTNVIEKEQKVLEPQPDNKYSLYGEY
jgi:hypothetical protein